MNLEDVYVKSMGTLFLDKSFDTFFFFLTWLCNSFNIKELLFPMCIIIPIISCLVLIILDIYIAEHVTLYLISNYLKIK